LPTLIFLISTALGQIYAQTSPKQQAYLQKEIEKICNQRAKEKGNTKYPLNIGEFTDKNTRQTNKQYPWKSRWDIKSEINMQKEYLSQLLQLITYFRTELNDLIFVKNTVNKNNIDQFLNSPEQKTKRKQVTDLLINRLNQWETKTDISWNDTIPWDNVAKYKKQMWNSFIVMDGPIKEGLNTALDSLNTFTQTGIVTIALDKPWSDYEQSEQYKELFKTYSSQNKKYPLYGSYSTRDNSFTVNINTNNETGEQTTTEEKARLGDLIKKIIIENNLNESVKEWFLLQIKLRSIDTTKDNKTWYIPTYEDLMKKPFDVKNGLKKILKWWNKVPKGANIS